MRIGLRRALVTLAVAAAALGVDAGSAQAAGGTLGQWTQAQGIIGTCSGGGLCSFSGSVGPGSCKEVTGASCSGTLASVTTLGPGGSCSGNGTTTFTYNSGTLQMSRNIPVTVVMASGVVSIDGSDGALTVHATANVLCIPTLLSASSFAVPWSGVVSYASTN